MVAAAAVAVEVLFLLEVALVGEVEMTDEHQKLKEAVVVVPAVVAVGQNLSLSATLVIVVGLNKIAREEEEVVEEEVAALFGPTLKKHSLRFGQNCIFPYDQLKPKHCYSNRVWKVSLEFSDYFLVSVFHLHLAL